MDTNLQSNLTPALIPVPAPPSGVLDFIDGKLLWKWKWGILLCVGLSAGLGYAFSSQQSLVYEVTSRVLVQLERMSTEKESLLRSDRTFLVTQAEIVASPVIVKGALQEMSPDAASQPDFAIVDAAIRSLRVTMVDDANVLRLTYRTGDPEKGTRLLKSIVNSYQHYMREMQRSHFGQPLEALAKHERELRTELSSLQEKFYKLRAESPVIGQGAEITQTNLTMLEELKTRLASARVLRIDKETAYDSFVEARNAKGLVVPTSFLLDTADSTPLAVDGIAIDGLSISSPHMDPSRILDQLWLAKSRLKELSPVFGPRHPERISAESQVKEWENRYQQFCSDEPDQLRSQLDSLRQSEANLEKWHAEEVARVKALDVNLIKEQHALAEIDRVQVIHDAATQQLRQLQMATDSTMDGQAAITVRVLEFPDGTAKIVWPKPPQFIAICGLFGFAFGCCAVTVTARVTGRS